MQADEARPGQVTPVPAAGNAAEGVPLAWWLVPSGPVARHWQAQIAQLARQTGGPVFEPHLTLAMSWLPDGVDPRGLAPVLCQALAPLWLRVTAVDHGPAYFQSVFLRMVPAADGALAGQVAQLTTALDGLWPSQTVAPAFAPHLSLVYGLLAEDRRQALVATIVPPAGAVCFDTLVAVRPRPGARTLANVADWDPFLRLSLVNTSSFPQKQG
ncbi:MAG: hypothetical protein Q4E06_08775 [Lautropia sp.]|nr:hypothetical protein [Lautropia sp.]